MCIYVHAYEELFSKTWFPNLVLALQRRFLDWRLMHFGKELFIYFSIKYVDDDDDELLKLKLKQIAYSILVRTAPISEALKGFTSLPLFVMEFAFL